MNSNLKQFLESIGTRLPADKELVHAGIDTSGGFKQGVCLFCFEPLPEVGRISLLQYYNNKSEDGRFRNTPYAICVKCYDKGVSKLDSARLHFAKSSLRTKLHYKYNRFVTERLTKYIESKGRKLPDDYKTYRTGMSNADSCLFCNDVPADFPVEIRYNDGWKVDSGTYCCYQCHHDASNELDEHNSWAEQLGADAMLRLTLFARKGEFDASVSEHYEHLIKDRDDDPDHLGPEGAYAGHCYFCKTVAPYAYKRIEVPVSLSNQLTGGVVRMCSKCNGVLLNFQNSDPLYKSLSTFVEEEICALCGVQYPVTTVEQRQREAVGSLGKHMCPACTHKTVWDSEPNLLSHFEPDFAQFQLGANPRYLKKQCEYCDRVVLLDLTIARRVLKSSHVSLEKKVICSTCNHKGKFPIFVDYNDLENFRYYKLKDHYEVVITDKNNDIHIETMRLNCHNPEELPIILERNRHGKETKL